MSNAILHLGNKLIVIGLVLGLAISLVTGLLISTVKVNKTDFEYETNRVAKLVQQQFDTVIVRVKDLAAFIASDMAGAVDTKLRQASRVSNNLTELGYFHSDSRDQIHVYYERQSTLDLKAGDFDAILQRLRSQPGLVISFAGGGSGMFRHIDPQDIVMMQSLKADDSLGLRLGQNRDLITYAVVDLDSILADIVWDLRVSRFIETRYLVEGQSRRLGALQPKSDPMLSGDLRQISLVATRNLSLTLEFERTFGASLTVALFATGILGLAGIAAGLFYVSEQRHQSAQLGLKQAAEAERQANTAKSDFLATMSHEIRTPLNGVLGMAELLTRSELTPTQRRYAEQIRTSGSMLLGILNDILDMSKLESGKLAVDIVKMDLPANLRETVGFFAANAQEKGLSILLDIDTDVPGTIGMDPMRLRQILSNLVANAIKFTEKGEIVVAASFEPTGTKRGDLTISVTDTGIGMTAEECGRLFNRFSQANSGTTRKYGGTGLGLAISKQLCEALGGTIHVDSKAGHGSRFSVCLPIDVHKGSAAAVWDYGSIALVCDSPAVVDIVDKTFRAAGAQPIQFPYTDDLANRLVMGDNAGRPFSLVIFNEERDIHLAKDQWQALRTRIIPLAKSIILGNQEANRNYGAFDGAVAKPFLPAVLVELAKDLMTKRDPGPDNEDVQLKTDGKPVKQLFEARNLLLVDDNHVNLLIAEEYLSRYGFIITTATNGVKAVRAAEDGNFDIIFMDCQMPEMDGYQATGILRDKMAKGEIRRVPIVALTANALKGDREQCLEAGMDDFLSKPLQDAALMGVFDRLIEIPEFAWLATPAQSAAAPTPVQKAEKSQAPLLRSKVGEAENATASATPPVLPRPEILAVAPVVENPPRQGASATRTLSANHASTTSTKVALMDVAEFQRTRVALKKFDLLLSLYRNDTAEYLQAIRQSLSVQSLDEAILPAHTIKSSSRMVGATGLSALAASMETRLRTKKGASAAELQALADKMERVFEATLAQIDRLMEQVPLQAAG